MASAPLIFGGIGSRAQVAGRIYRVGYFEIAGSPPKGSWGDVLEEFLVKEGFVAGGNSRFEYVFVDWADQDLRWERARQLVATNPDVVFTEAPRTLQAATRTIPIVIANSNPDEALRLVGDLRHPRGNITGVVGRYSEHLEKRLEMTRELLPKATRMALIYNNGSIMSEDGSERRKRLPEDLLAEIEASAQRLGFKVIHGDISMYGDDLDETLDHVRAARAEVIFPIASAFLGPGRYGKLAKFQETHGIPYIGDGGGGGRVSRGVIAYATDWSDHYHRAAQIIAKILRGARPADIPVEIASRFLLSVDQRVAALIHVDIPPSILVRADHIFR